MGWFLKFIGALLLVLNLGLALVIFLAGYVPAVRDVLPADLATLVRTISTGWAVFLAIFGSIWPVLFIAVGEIYDTTQAMKAKLDTLNFAPEVVSEPEPEPAPHPQPTLAAAELPPDPYIPTEPDAPAQVQPDGPLPSRRSRQP